jgi:APA family basic amino acid/polyamine antiporter
LSRIAHRRETADHSFPHAADDVDLQRASQSRSFTHVFTGWNASSYIIGEVKIRTQCSAFARRDDHRCRGLRPPECGFSGNNAGSEMRGQLEVGLIAGKHIFGNNGGRIVGAMICLG